MKKAFDKYDVVIGSRQPKSLKKILTKSRFPPTQPETADIRRPNGLYHCYNCIYHQSGFIVECTSFMFGENLQFEWRYNRYFDCKSNNVIYILICNYCWYFYIGETDDLKQRTCLHKSNTVYPGNSNCSKLSYHLHHHSKLQTPYFRIYPIFYVTDTHRRRFLDKRLIHKYKPPLNSDT